MRKSALRTHCFIPPYARVFTSSYLFLYHNLTEEGQDVRCGCSQPGQPCQPYLSMPHDVAEVWHHENLAKLDQVAGKRFTVSGFPWCIRDGTRSLLWAVAVLED